MPERYYTIAGLGELYKLIFELSPFDNYIITPLCELNMNFRGISKNFSEKFFGLSKAHP